MAPSRLPGIKVRSHSAVLVDTSGHPPRHVALWIDLKQVNFCVKRLQSHCLIFNFFSIRCFSLIPRSLIAVWPWPSYQTSLSFTFHIHAMGMRTTIPLMRKGQVRYCIESPLHSTWQVVSAHKDGYCHLPYSSPQPSNPCASGQKVLVSPLSHSSASHPPVYPQESRWQV